MPDQSVISGSDSLLQLADLAEKHNWNKLFIVVGKTSYQKTGAEDIIGKLFNKDQVVIFNDFKINPQITDVYRGAEMFRNSHADVIVSIGGGSAIDMAKLINCLSHVHSDYGKFILDKRTIEKVAVPHVAVPTTSGSGSEATHFAVVYVDGIKYSLADQLLLPSFVILDPELTNSMPSFITAYTAMDALCQAMESYWSVNSTEESSRFSLQSIRLILDNIRDAVKTPTLENRKAIQQGSYYAGKAINITKTTAAHALSYYLTSHFDIPHGYAVALMFGWVYKQNNLVNDSSCNDPRGAGAVRSRLDTLNDLFHVGNADNFVAVFYKLMKDNQLPVSIMPIDRDTIKSLFASVNVERLTNNPVKIDLSLEEEFIDFIKQYF